jgi:hypothetical protein
MRTSHLTLIAAIACVAFGLADRRAAAQVPPVPAAASASSSAPSGPGAHPPEVIITGDRAAYASRISTFVNQVTNFDLGDPGRGLARWLDPVCPLVTGLSRQSGEYILERVSEIAQAAGAPIGGEKCHPNLFIIVTSQPEADLKDLENRHLADVFGGADPAIIDGFIAIRRPVKTWYDTVQKTPEGLPLLVESFPGISQQYGVIKPPGGLEIFPVRPDAADAAVTNPWSEASHLVLNAVWVIQRVFVIVDPTQFKGVTRGQLADYVAMSGLAQIKLDAHLADASTILALFDKGPQIASPGLTQWDQLFLKSVYSTTPKSILQRSAITHEMVDAIMPP